MKAFVITTVAAVTLLSGCISISRQSQPESTTTTTRTSAVVTPGATTVQRTTTY